MQRWYCCTLKSIGSRFSHVSCVAEGSEASLRCALVVAHLEVEVTFRSPQLILRELSLVLFGHLGSEVRALVFRVFLSLECLIRYDGVRSSLITAPSGHFFFGRSLHTIYNFRRPILIINPSYFD